MSAGTAAENIVKAGEAIAKNGEKIASNAAVQKGEGWFGKFVGRLKGNAGNFERNMENRSKQMIDDLSENIGKLSEKEFDKSVKKYDEIFEKSGLGEELTQIQNIAMNNLALNNSAEDVEKMTKDDIQAAMDNALKAQKKGARWDTTKDWFADPVREFRNAEDGADKAEAIKKMGVRYGATAAAGVGAIGVTHDLMSDDEHDWGLGTAVGSGVTLGTTAGGAALISKMIKV